MKTKLRQQKKEKYKNILKSEEDDLNPLERFLYGKLREKNGHYNHNCQSWKCTFENNLFKDVGNPIIDGVECMVSFNFSTKRLVIEPLYNKKIKRDNNTRSLEYSTYLKSKYRYYQDFLKNIILTLNTIEYSKEISKILGKLLYCKYTCSIRENDMSEYFSYMKSRGLYSIESCIVCYEDTQYKIDCGHFLCYKCIEKLIKTEQDKCPMCRKDFLEENNDIAPLIQQFLSENHEITRTVLTIEVPN